MNSMIAARGMTGDQGHYANALPHDALMEVMALSGR